MAALIVAPADEPAIGRERAAVIIAQGQRSVRARGRNRLSPAVVAPTADRAVAERTHLEPPEVERVLDALSEVVLKELSADGPDAVTVAGLVKAEVRPEAARPERAGRNPSTGEPITIAARPARARGKLKLRPLKRLRDAL